MCNTVWQRYNYFFIAFPETKSDFGAVRTFPSSARSVRRRSFGAAVIAARTLLAALESHAVSDPTEGKHVECCIELLGNSPRDWWRRERAGGHVTASAWVT